jgi:hypothetical protein
MIANRPREGQPLPDRRGVDLRRYVSAPTQGPSEGGAIASSVTDGPSSLQSADDGPRMEGSASATKSKRLSNRSTIVAIVHPSVKKVRPVGASKTMVYRIPQDINGFARLSSKSFCGCCLESTQAATACG